MFLVISLYF